MIREDGESYLSFVKRSTEALANGLVNYSEWSENIFDDVPYSDETMRRVAVCFKKFLDTVEEEKLENADEDMLVNIQRAKGDLERERMKLFDEKRELKESYRWEARNELWQEKITNAILRLDKIEPPKVETQFSINGNTALLGIADIHAGSTFEVKGLYGEIVNKYDYNIMMARMWSLLRKINCEDMVFDDMVVAICGDCFENILRMSSLSKLREPVLDTVIKFSEFMSQWIVEVQRIFAVPIKVISVGGNHDVQRLLGSKPSFEDENLMKVFVEFLKLRLKDCKDIYVCDYTDVAVENIRGTNIMFQHGEDKDLKATMNYFENLYNISVDEIYAGHLHHPETKTVGITEVGDRQVNRLGSICGVDPYSKKIRASARPSASMVLYNDEGRSWSKNIYL